MNLDGFCVRVPINIPGLRCLFIHSCLNCVFTHCSFIHLLIHLCVCLGFFCCCLFFVVVFFCLFFVFCPVKGSFLSFGQHHLSSAWTEGFERELPPVHATSTSAARLSKKRVRHALSAYSC